MLEGDFANLLTQRVRVKWHGDIRQATNDGLKFPCVTCFEYVIDEQPTPVTAAVLNALAAIFPRVHTLIIGSNLFAIQSLGAFSSLQHLHVRLLGVCPAQCDACVVHF